MEPNRERGLNGLSYLVHRHPTIGHMGWKQASKRLMTALFFNNFDLGKAIALQDRENTTWTSLAANK